MAWPYTGDHKAYMYHFCIPHHKAWIICSPEIALKFNEVKYSIT